ncbi:MAG: glycosyltransferase [Armatimonadota bacterium]
MKVLYISPYIPTRIRVRTYSLIKELAKHHEVHVIALCDTKNDEQTPGKDELQGILSSFKIVNHHKLMAILQALIALPTSHPMCTAYCWSRQMSKEIDDLLGKGVFDIIHIEHLRAAHFHPRSNGVPVVFDSVDCLSALFEQMSKSNQHSMASRLTMKEEAWKLKHYEPRMLGRFDRILTTTDIERQAILNMNPELNISVVPNGVDTEYFQPSNVPRQPGKMIFTGKMSYTPNAQAAAWFATKVLPYIRSKFPFTEFIIAGSNPPRETLDLAELPGVSVTGYVPDMRLQLENSSIAVAPMQIAAGIQNKILEAMAMALPVVASKITLRAFGDEHPGIIGAESADDMIQAICALIKSPERANELGENGRTEVCQKYSWSSSASQIGDIYTQLSVDCR